MLISLLPRDPDYWETQLKVDTCVACNGYYGPCFGEPVCATCHAFLYASHLELELLIPEVGFPFIIRDKQSYKKRSLDSPIARWCIPFPLDTVD